MMDRFNVWVGSLYTRSLDIKKDEGQTFVEYALVLVLVARRRRAARRSGLASSAGSVRAIGDVTNALK